MTLQLFPAVDFIRHLVGAARLAVTAGADLVNEDSVHTIDSRADPENVRRLCVETMARGVDADGIGVTGAGIASMRVPRTRDYILSGGVDWIRCRPRRVPVTIRGTPGAALTVYATGADDTGWTVDVGYVDGVTTLGQIVAAFLLSQDPAGVAGTVLPAELCEATTNNGAAVINAPNPWGSALYATLPAPLVVPGELDADGRFVPSTRDSTLETIYRSPADVACGPGAGYSFLTPFLNVEACEFLTFFILNTGANATSSLIQYFSPDAPGGAWGIGGVGGATVVGPGAIHVGTGAPQAASAWGAPTQPRAEFRGFRMTMQSILGTTVQVRILGRRAK